MEELKKVNNIFEEEKKDKLNKEKLDILMREQNKINNASDEDKKIMDIPVNVPEEERVHGLIKEEGKALVTPNGKIFPLNDDEDDDFNIDDIELTPEEEAEIEGMWNDAYNEGNGFTAKHMQQYILNQFSFLTEAETKIVSNVIDRVRNKEEFSVYNALPDSMKNFIKLQMSGVREKTAVNMAARAFINNIIDEIVSFQAMESFGESIEKKKNEMFDELSKEAVSGYLANYILKFDSYKIAAEKIRSKEDISEEDEKAISEAMDVYNAIQDVLSLQPIIDDLKSKPGKYVFKRRQLDKFPRECESFNMKYSRSIYSIKDLNLIAPSIVTLIECTEITAKLIVLAFIRYTLNFSVDVSYENIFMQNFIAVILLSISATSEDDMKIVDKIKSALNEIAGLI